MKWIDTMVKNFQERYPYMACGRDVLEEAAKGMVNFPNDVALDLMKDFILSRGLAEGMEI